MFKYKYNPKFQISKILILTWACMMNYNGDTLQENIFIKPKSKYQAHLNVQIQVVKPNSNPKFQISKIWILTWADNL